MLSLSFHLGLSFNTVEANPYANTGSNVYLVKSNKGVEFKFLDDNIVLFHCGHLPANYA